MKAEAAMPPFFVCLGDWRYDEFRLSERGHLIHEIEWAPQVQGKPLSWIIEADDIDFRWIPMKTERA